MKKTNMKLVDLAPELLQLIITQLNNKDRSTLTLVSKFFKTLTDSFVHKINLNQIPSTTSLFCKLFTRFSTVTHIQINLSDQTVYPLLSIARSQLGAGGFELFPMVKALIFTCEVSTIDVQVFEFIRMFPSVEEINLSECFECRDEWIEKLVCCVPNLRKMDMDYMWNLTDHSFVVLGDCANLEHISLDGYEGTVKGFCAFVRKRRNLKSLVVPCLGLPASQASNYLELAETISSCENLSHLTINLDGDILTDTFLIGVGNSRSTLTSLYFFGCSDDVRNNNDYTMTGLSAVICAFRCLTDLYIFLPSVRLRTQDVEMSQLVTSLTCLKYVTLDSMTSLHATLFSLIQSCPLLESITILSSGGHRYHEVSRPMRKNYSVRYILLSLGHFPDYLLVKTLKSVCPCLRELKMLTADC